MLRECLVSSTFIMLSLIYTPEISNNLLLFLPKSTDAPKTKSIQKGIEAK